MRSRVAVGDQGGTRTIEPLVAVRVIPVPMGIDDELNATRAQSRQHGLELLLRYSDASVDHELAPTTDQDRDVATGPAHEAHSASQRRERHGRSLRLGVDLVYRAIRVRE